MYIAQIIDGITPGGAEKLQITFAQEAHSRGLRLMIICLAESKGSPYPEQLTALGATIHYFPSQRLINSRRLWEIVKLLRREHPDVLHTHLTYSNITGAIVGLFARVPVVSTLHTIGTEPRHYHPLRERLETWALRFVARRVIAIGPAVAEAYGQRLRGKILDVIPNAITPFPPLSPSDRAAVRAEVMGDGMSNCQLIISAGRLSPPKAFHDLLTAFSILRRTEPNTFLVIAGTGVLYDQLAIQIVDLNLSGSALLLGLRNDVPRLLAASDMFVSSSHWEGLPLVVLEAMGAGLPLIATDVGDVAWAVAETGVIVPPNQPEMLAGAMRSLLNDPARRNELGQMAKKRMESRFSASIWFDEIMSLYREICEPAS